MTDGGEVRRRLKPEADDSGGGSLYKYPNGFHRHGGMTDGGGSNSNMGVEWLHLQQRLNPGLGVDLPAIRFFE